MLIELPDGISLDIVLDDWVQQDPYPDLSSYIAGLPDASGEFTGTYDAAVVSSALGPLPDTVSVEVDTYGRPNPLAAAPAGSVLTFAFGDRKYRMTVHRTELLGGNRVRALVWRDSVTEVTEENGDE